MALASVLVSRPLKVARALVGVQNRGPQSRWKTIINGTGPYVFESMYDYRKSQLAESELRFYFSMGSKMYDFAWVFESMYDYRKSPLAESELRFYLSMGSKMYDFA